MNFITPYIKEDWVNNIRNYKYKGSDNSLVYKYIASPFCNIIVEKLPMTLAPNVITTCGLICNIILFCITHYYTGFNGKDSIPKWACYTSSFLYFSYYMFDNLDGKQARRTKTSSPLGLLFDHGCDAMTTFIFSQSLASYVGLDDPLYFSLLWLMTSLPFFLNTWEEYYTGALNLPIINGVGEGTVCACIVMIITGELGREFWVQEIIFVDYVFRLNHLIVLIFFSSGVFFAIISLYNVLKEFRDKLADAIENLFIFIFLVVTLIFVVIYGDSKIIRDHPKIINILYGFSFAKLVGHLQLAHLSNAKFMQFRKSLLSTFFLLWATTVLDYFYDIKFIELDTLIITILLIHILVWMHFAYYVTEELCEILNIKRFSVGKRYQHITDETKTE